MSSDINIFGESRCVGTTPTRMGVQEKIMGIEHLEVAADNLTTLCNPEDLGFETTAELEPLDGTIGQERAESALELSLVLDSP
ncbi:MAG: hypothetical protein IIB14_08070, partial [Chloroflexi bacterium]|nr:hypothetical protein [Chloroflexota bacterium]